MSTAVAYDLESYWRDLTDPGRHREFLRLEPTEDIPVTVAARGESGWELDERSVRDISLGGLALVLRAWEARRVRVGEMVRLLLTLGDRPFEVYGRTVHLSRMHRGFLPRYHLGIEFVGDAALQRALKHLVLTLHELNRRRPEPAPDIRT